MSFLKQFIPPILTYKNFNDRLYRYKMSRSDQKINFENNHFNRTAFVNKAVSLKKNCKYLEIGCDTNDNFDCIPLSLKDKIGLDPSRGGTHKITSDEFFKNNKNKFDVIFIDGLHVYEQCKKDCINSVKSLNDGGIILFHDFLPKDKYFEDLNRPIDGWSGDVWKVGVELNNSKGVDFKIVNIDSGVGILKIHSNFEYNHMEELSNKTFYDFFNSYLPKLPLINSEVALDFIENR